MIFFSNTFRKYLSIVYTNYNISKHKNTSTNIHTYLEPLSRCINMSKYGYFN